MSEILDEIPNSNSYNYRFKPVAVIILCFLILIFKLLEIYCPTSKDLDAMPEIEEMENKINNWVKQNFVIIKNLSKNITLTWEQLDSIGSFPARGEKSS